MTYTKEWPEVKKTDVAIKRLEGELEKAATETVSMLKARFEAPQGHENSIREMYLTAARHDRPEHSRSDRDGRLHATSRDQ